MSKTYRKNDENYEFKRQKEARKRQKYEKKREFLKEERKDKDEGYTSDRKSEY